MSLERVKLVPEPRLPARQAPACPRAEAGCGHDTPQVSMPRSGKQGPCPTRKSTETDPERTKVMQFTEKRLERATINITKDLKGNVDRVVRKICTQMVLLELKLQYQK